MSVVEGSTDHHFRLDALDPAVGPLVTVNAIVRVHPVELELHVDPGERDALVVSVESEGDGFSIGCFASTVKTR